MTVSALDGFRLRIGDRDSNRPLFNDLEAQFFIDEYPNDPLLAAASACESLAARFAGDYDFEWKGSDTADGKFNRAQASKQYAAMAVAFRARASNTVTTVSTTREDGYSEDITSRDGAGQGSSTGRVRAGYQTPDSPV